jgi:hypothetical protein
MMRQFYRLRSLRADELAERDADGSPGALGSLDEGAGALDRSVPRPGLDAPTPVTVRNKPRPAATKATASRKAPSACSRGSRPAAAPTSAGKATKSASSVTVGVTMTVSPDGAQAPVAAGPIDG